MLVLLTVALAAAWAAPAAGRDSTAARPDSAVVAALPFRLALRDTAAISRPNGAELGEPSGLVVDAFGRLFVCDAALNRVQRYDGQGRWLGSSGTLGNDPTQLRRPGGLGLLGALRLAVLDCENRRVVAYDLFGKLDGVWADFTTRDLEDAIGRVDPIALASDRGGAVVVADRERDRLLAFDFSGRFQREIGGYGARPGSFRGLAGVAFAPHGELVTAERVGARVQRLDAGGRVVASWPLHVGPGRGALAIAVDDSSRIAIADEQSGRVTVFDRTGRVLAERDDFAAPRALAFGPDGALLVAEAGAARVRRFTLEPAAAGRD
ncbi:MAG TPA: NHL repeat-containing protein [Candidatus Saccharimonadaceae bacterium]|nr:NHL repeat-containing protein [Candidatus Saccharimonadaceae bacterium]